MSESTIPAAFRDAVERGSYEWGTTVWGMIASRAAATPDAVLVTDEKGSAVTVGEFVRRSEAFAAALFERGIRSRSVVSWQMANNVESMVIFAALCRLDAVQNPLIMILRETEVRFITGQAGTELLIVPEAHRRFGHGEMARTIAAERPGMDLLVIDGALPEGDPDVLPAVPPGDGRAVRWLYYTSGTTAEPKGAKHSDAHLIAGASNFCDSIQPLPSDKLANVAPMAHVGGVLFFLSALVSGAEFIISEVFDPVETTRQLSVAGVTICGSGVPFIQAFLAQQRLDPSTPVFPDVRVFIVGGASRIESLHYEAKRELGGVGIVSGYGMTESPFIVFGRPDDDDWHHALADGRPGRRVDLRIVKDDGSIAAPGEIGEVRFRSETLMDGYVDSALDATAFDQDGYFRSGDLAYLDAEGYLVIAGRIKDVIIRNMENISAREVEIPLIEHPKVLIASVIGLPDAQTGERVCAVVVPNSPGDAPSLDELCEHLRASGLNPRKLPVQLEIVDELPLNAMGKVMKQQLQKQFAPRATTPGGKQS